MRHIVSFSGGKDSTAMLLMMIEKNMPIDEIIFIEVMANDKLSGELPGMPEYIEKIERYIGRKITKIKSKHTFESVFYRIPKRKTEKTRIFQGKILGFPMTLFAWCNDRLKISPLKEYYKNQKEPFTVYLGIAADEPKRLKRLKSYQKAPLSEWGITEQDCKKYLEQRGLLNPLYSKVDRLGCWFCVKQSLKSLRYLYNEQPELWEKLKQYQKDSNHVLFQPKKSIFDIDKRFNEESGRICTCQTNR